MHFICTVEPEALYQVIRAEYNTEPDSKKMLTEGSCLANCAKDKDSMVTTDTSKTELGITLCQKQEDGNIKPIAYRADI